MRWFLLLLAAGLVAACQGSDAPDVARGKRLAAIMGCTSCHGAKLDGHLFEEDPQFALAWSSNLSRILPGWSDAQIDATLRTGKRPDGTPLWFMPTFAHQRMTPSDMRDLIGWLRTVPPSGTLHPPIKRGPQFEAALAQGFQNSAAQAVRLAARVPADGGNRTAAGRHLASLACAECHGPDLAGVPDPRPGDPPDLRVAAAYSGEAFARLLAQGVAQDGRPAGQMAVEARKRLSALEANEVEAIRAYLVARAKR